MVTIEKAKEFANHWVNAWNNHNLNEVFTHYTDDFEMTTPFIASMMGIASGTLKGKQRVGEYWTKALSKFPDLKFNIIDVLHSVNSVTIYYESVQNKRSAEIFLFDESGKVYKAISHYN